MPFGVFNGLDLLAIIVIAVVALAVVPYCIRRAREEAREPDPQPESRTVKQTLNEWGAELDQMFGGGK